MLRQRHISAWCTCVDGLIIAALHMLCTVYTMQMRTTRRRPTAGAGAAVTTAAAAGIAAATTDATDASAAARPPTRSHSR
jgi:hypothetical protein